MLKTRKTLEITFGCLKVNQIISFHCHLKKNKISELKDYILHFNPGVSGQQVKLNQIARYHE
jgi:hypothetical protein